MMNDAAKPDCILPIGDDGSLNGGCFSGELIVIKVSTESEYNSNLQIGMALSINSLSAKSILVGEKLVATYSNSN